MNTLIILSIFSKINVWTVSAVAGIVLSFAAVKNKMKLLDLAAKFTYKWSGIIYLKIQEYSSILLDIQNTSKILDDAIAQDGSTDFNTLKEAIDSGKKVVVKLEDAILELKALKKK